VGLLCAGFLTGSCASIIHGTSQEVSISSNPTGAQVTVDGVLMGKTPVVAKLGRGDTHKVRIELPGYEPYETALTKSVSGWVWGNVLFGGLIGLAVDAVSGGLYYLNPEQVQGELRKGEAQPEAVPAKATLPDASNRTDDGIVIAVVLHPEAGWERIGQLDPL
jgi:PEGA domain